MKVRKTESRSAVLERSASEQKLFGGVDSAFSDRLAPLMQLKMTQHAQSVPTDAPHFKINSNASVMWFLSMKMCFFGCIFLVLFLVVLLCF